MRGEVAEVVDAEGEVVEDLVAEDDRGAAAEVGSQLLRDLAAEPVLVAAAQVEAAQEVEQVQVRALVELVLEPALAEQVQVVLAVPDQVVLAESAALAVRVVPEPALVVLEESAVLVVLELALVVLVALAVLVAPVSELVVLVCRDWVRAELESAVVPEFVPAQPSLAARRWVLMEPPSARTVATSGINIRD